MTDAQWEYLFERVLTKLEEIRCGLIDIETLLEERNKQEGISVEPIKKWKDPYISEEGIR